MGKCGGSLEQHSATAPVDAVAPLWSVMHHRLLTVHVVHGIHYIHNREVRIGKVDGKTQARKKEAYPPTRVLDQKRSQVEEKTYK